MTVILGLPMENPTGKVTPLIGDPPLSVEASRKEMRCQRSAGDYDPEFRDGAVRVVRETGKSIRQVADDLGVNSGMLGNWVMKDKIARGERLDPRHVDPDRVRALKREIEDLKQERDVLKRSVVLWVKEATNR